MKITSIFIHIPRTAGTAIKWALNNKIHDLEYINAQDHRTAIERRSELGSLWDSFYKFTIVRNPWDRAVSWYHHCGETRPFTEWLLQTDISQERYFMDGHKTIVNDVFRYESLTQNFVTICERAGWPRLDSFWLVNDTIRRPYQEYYDLVSIKHVADQCRRLIDAFDYTY